MIGLLLVVLSGGSKKTNMLVAIASGRPLSTGLELTSYFAEGATHSLGAG
jgi:hypothetical protein